MKISKKAYYGLRAVVGIAHFKEISAHALAQEENLPEDYLQKILQQLKKAGIVSAEKGVAGGYSLARSEKDISVWDILSVLDGEIIPFAPPKMTADAPYPKLTHCQTSVAWRLLSSKITETLSAVTVAELMTSTATLKAQESKHKIPDKAQSQKHKR